jgi:iron complex transport system substrate-binding protein
MEVVMFVVKNPGLFVLGLSLLFTGCSGKAGNSSSAGTGSAEGISSAPAEARIEADYPVTVHNYAPSPDGSVWRDKDQTFDAAPSRVVANTQGAAELLLHLGLEDRIVGVGAVSGSVDPEVAGAFSKLRVLSENYIGKEITMGTQPDLVFGRGGLFAEADWGVGSVDDLNSYGVKTYIQNTSRPGAVIEDLYRDIEELGRIFGVSNQASAFAEKLRVREAKIRAAGRQGQRITYAYLNAMQDGMPNVYAGNKDTFLSGAMDLLGLVNAFSDAEAEVIDLETLIAANPGILLWFTYSGGPDIPAMRDELYASPALQNMTAIADKQIYIFEYNEFWSYSYRIFSVLEKLGAALYPEQFPSL